jgi:hypothetical protein
MPRKETEHDRRRVTGGTDGVGTTLSERGVAFACLVRGLPGERGNYRVDGRLA